MADMPTLEQFLAGKPLAFKSLQGHDRLATYRTGGMAPYLELAYPGGKVIMRPVMGEHEARQWYANASAESQT